MESTFPFDVSPQPGHTHAQVQVFPRFPCCSSGAVHPSDWIVMHVTAFYTSCFKLETASVWREGQAKAFPEPSTYTIFAFSVVRYTAWVSEPLSRGTANSIKTELSMFF